MAYINRTEIWSRKAIGEIVVVLVFKEFKRNERVQNSGAWSGVEYNT